MNTSSGTLLNGKEGFMQFLHFQSLYELLRVFVDLSILTVHDL